MRFFDKNQCDFTHFYSFLTIFRDFIQPSEITSFFYNNCLISGGSFPLPPAYATDVLSQNGSDLLYKFAFAFKGFNCFNSKHARCLHNYDRLIIFYSWHIIFSRCYCNNIFLISYIPGIFPIKIINN